METLTVRFAYTRPEFVKAARQYLLASGVIRKWHPAVAAACLVYAFIFRLYPTIRGLSVALLAIAVLITAIEIFLYGCWPALMFKRGPQYHEPFALTFSETGVTLTTPGADTLSAWDKYTEIWESGAFYFLLQATPKHAYAYIPKRAFASPEAGQAFIAAAPLPVRRIR